MFNIPFYNYKIKNWQEKKQKLLEICSTIDFKNQDIGNRKLNSYNADNLYTDYWIFVMIIQGVYLNSSPPLNLLSGGLQVTNLRKC